MNKLPPAKFEPRHPREQQWTRLLTLLRELFQLSDRGAPVGELTAQIARLKTEHEKFEQLRD